MIIMSNIYDWYTKVISKDAQFITPLSKVKFIEFEKNYWKWVDQLQKDAKILEFWAWNWNFVQYLLNKWFTNITIVEYSQSVFEEQKIFFWNKVKIEKNDVLSYLKESKQKFDFIIWIHVIEHLETDYFYNLLESVWLSLNTNWFCIFETPNMSNIVYWNYFRFIDFTHKTWFSSITIDWIVKSTMQGTEIDFRDKVYISLFDLFKLKKLNLKDFVKIENSETKEKRNNSFFKKIWSAYRFLLAQPFKVWLSKFKSKYYLKNFEGFPWNKVFAPSFITIIKKVWK